LGYHNEETTRVIINPVNQPRRETIHLCTFGRTRDKIKKYDQKTSYFKLALNYFTGHGPAQLKDFSWWSGLAEDAIRILLSIYDEYTIAYKDRGDISEERDIEKMISMGNALTVRVQKTF
jgi:hypothetical protein